MEEIGNKYLYNNKTEKIRTKKIVPIRQIIIRKNGTKVNTIFKEISNIPHKIKRYSNLYNSAIFSRGKYNEIKTLTDKINLSNKINEPKEILNYKTSVNKTIVKPVIYQESFLKPIILPVNVKYFDDFENQDYNQLTATNNSQTIDISKDIKNKNLQKIKHKFFPIEKIDTNKENINQNIKENIIRKKVIIQKNTKFNDKYIYNQKNNETKQFLNGPLPKEQDTLVINKLKTHNSLKSHLEKRIKYNTIQPKLNLDNIFNNNTKDKTRNNIIYKSQRLSKEQNVSTINNKDNLLRKSMKPLEKMNNITINNTLKQKYEDIIKDKKIVVGLNHQIEKYSQIGPKDSIRFKEKLV